MDAETIRKAILDAKAAILCTKDSQLSSDAIGQFKRAFWVFAEPLPGSPQFSTQLRYFRILMRDCGLLDEPAGKPSGTDKMLEEADLLLQALEKGSPP